MDNDKYIGRLLDNRYEIQEVIGIGGMAIVYKARCHRLNRLVAVKILKDEFSKDEEFRRRFQAEGQAVAMLSHPNIVSVYDVSTADEADYIVMELIDGISLKQYMEKKGVLNWKETLHFAIQISKALEHAHSRGIVHRDIKPHNIMVLKNGSVKVADFGIARVMSKGNTLTKEALGSVHYISPEQAKGGRVDDRSDIYSLGTVMYEMMTGRPPYDGESPVAVAIQHINGGAKMPSVLNPNIPGGLEQIIMKAMAHEPSARYNSATAMLADMDEFRKLPTILFDYNTPPTDEVTRLQSAYLATNKPRPSVAERVAAGSVPLAARSREQSSIRTDGSQRRREESERRRREYEEEEDRSRIATIAIIACSAVAIIAILIFLFALFNDGILGNNQQLVVVPTLVGKNYDTLQISDSFIINEPKYAYDDTYEKGRITEQNPKPGEKVNVGTGITITVSLGPAPQVKTMENLVGQKRTTAENYLNGLGQLFLCKEEYSDTVEEGYVTRTSPAEGEPLEDGQTVTLWISLGAEIVDRDMTDVVNQSLETAKTILGMQGLALKFQVEEEASDEVDEGYVIRTKPAVGEKIKTGDTVVLYVSTGPKKVKMINVVGEDIDTALKLLKVAGFTNIKCDDYVEDEAPVDQVVTQSVAENTEIPVNTQIVLQISKGPAEITKMVNFGLMEDMIEAYEVIITRKDTGEEIFNASISASKTEISLELSGKGKVIYVVTMGGNTSYEQEVDFSTP